MAIDTSAPESPGWWIARLTKLLVARRPELQQLWDRYDGNAPIPLGADPSAADAYRKFRRMCRVNWAGKIVQARRDRSKVMGFRTAVHGDTNGDALAAAMWRRSRMQVGWGDFVTNLMVMRECALFVELRHHKAHLTVEDPRQVYVLEDPVVPGKVLAVVKLYHDDARDLDVVYLHLAPTGEERTSRVYRATRARKATGRAAVTFSASTFVWDDEMGGADGVDTGLSRIPVAVARMHGNKGVFERHTDLLDALDQSAFERRVISAVQAWRQRAVMVPDGADEDEKGQPIDWDAILVAEPGTFWKMPENTKFWESMVADLRPQIEVEQHEIRIVADVTSTPMRSFHTDAAGGSAEGAASQKEDLVFAVEDISDVAGEAACDAVSIGFELERDAERAERERLTVLFADPARRSLAERADAWSKTADMDERERYIRVWGLTPAEYDEVLAGRLQTTLVDSLGIEEDDEPSEPAVVEPVADAA